MKTKNTKRAANLLAIPLSLALMLTGCGGEPSTQEPGAAKESESSSAAESSTPSEAAEGVVNKTNPEGLPIAAEPITLTVGVSASSSSFQGEWASLDWIKQIQEASGITLDFRVYNSNEDKNLMFTSRDYPDISFNVGSDKQILDAAMGGDIYALDELIDSYAPTWKAYLEKDDYARKVVTMSDGHIYSLPIVRDEPSNGGLRDQWLIQKTWLDELNLQVPTTTEGLQGECRNREHPPGRDSLLYLWNPQQCGRRIGYHQFIRRAGGQRALYGHSGRQRKGGIQLCQ